MALSAGDSFGRYEVQRELGRGAMGVVYSARHRDLQRDVALKVLAPTLSHVDEYRHRFLREAQSLARLDSPYVVRVFDAGDESGQLFIATELITGGDMTSRLQASGAFPVTEAVRLVTEVAEGLVAAHDAGILHRDIKPSNVLLRPGRDGRSQAVLCDFGIATAEDAEHTATVGVLGTPGYLAPERYDGAPASVSSDVYALGCLLWAALTGTSPYAGTAAQVLKGHVQGLIPQLPVRSQVDQALNQVLSRAMAKAPAHRYQDARSFLAALSAAAVAPSGPVLPVEDRTIRVRPPVGVPAPPPPPLPPQHVPPQPFGPAATKASGRGPVVLVAALVALAVFLVAGAAVAAVVTLRGDDGPAEPSVRVDDMPTGRPSVRPSSTPSATATATTPAQAQAPDPLGVGFPERNLGCTNQFIVVLTSEEGPTPVATVGDALNRFPSAPDRAYLDPSRSCGNLGRLGNKVNLSRFPYMGPFADPVSACEARMDHADTTTYVIGLSADATVATYCACSYDDAALARLNSTSDAEPTGDDRFWVLELQYMLFDAGYNPDRLVGGNFGSQTAQMVSSLQADFGLSASGALDAATWGALRSAVC